jgi:DNA-binding LacI/PurR family transcriptional regulator
LALDPRLTAVFAANDDMAIGVIRALVEAGRSVPDDVSVVGFDDIPAAAYLWPSLTTFRNPFKEDAARGVAALVGAIEHPDVPPHVVEGPPGELVIRESTAPPGRGGKSTRIAGGIATEE